MSDFNSWEEVRDWLEKGEVVYYWAWTYSHNYMSCGEDGCCEQDFDSVGEVIESLKRCCSGRLNMVDKV